VGLIVDAADPWWSWLIHYTMPDNDVVSIDARALEVAGYVPGVGTTNLGIAVRPGTGEVYVANTEARNRVRFEPNLRGHFVDNRVTRLEPGRTTAYDLNPAIDYSVLPNAEAQAQALAQPTALAFEPDGETLYVAAFGSDRVGVLDAAGHVLDRIELRPAGATSRRMRGPRGLALQAATRRLYVLNRLSNTISVVDAASRTLLGETPVGFDPTPAFIRAGRGFLYDARLSGNGTASCASCHVDADMDLIAWDLGDPGGELQTIVQTDETFTLHPMKGPMTTQALRGLRGMEPYHWRGDRADFAAFNGAFDRLMGGSALSDADMATYTAFVESVTFMPNPNRNLDGTLPASLAGGDARAGLVAFVFEPVRDGVPTTCHSCHTVQRGGTNRELHPQTLQSQPLKVPHLRNLYQKLLFSRRENLPTIGGFGLNHDGMFAGLWEFLSQRAVGRFADDTRTKLDLMAFLLSFDTGTPPAVGFNLTLNAAGLGDAEALQSWKVLRQQAAAGEIDLVAKGTIRGRPGGLVYRPASDDYLPDRAALRPLRNDQVVGRLLTGDTLTFMGVPAGSGWRMGIDRDGDGLLDGDDPALAAPPAVSTDTAVRATPSRAAYGRAPAGH
jgi:YVTN family beta-propeller protein